MNNINLSEIRVGNYLLYEKTIHKVISIDGITGTVGSWWVNHKINKTVIEFKEDGSYNPYLSNFKYYEGIPINIKDLKRFDIPYEKNSKKMRKFGSNFDYIFYLGGSIKVKFFKKEFTVQTQGEGITRIIEIKYIHELQNLVQSLYGKELYLKEKLATSLSIK